MSANLSGHDSHGVVRVPRYAAQKKNGTVVADVTVDVLVDTPVIAVVDGKYGFGQTVTPQAVQIGIAKCRNNGLSAVTLRNAGHVGRVGDWAEMAAEAGLVSIHFVNASGSVLVAPYGGVQRRFSTAPYCVGVPRPGHDPLVLDFATSIVAEGKVLVASQGGKKLPDGALIGPDGTPGSDPHLLYGDYTPTGPRDHSKGTGAIQAFGDHKGSGLAFMCEILGGALSGTGATDPKRGRFANGMLSFYVDPSVFDPVGLLPRRHRQVRRLRRRAPSPRRRAARSWCRASPRRACAPGGWPRACRCPTTPGPPSSKRRAPSGLTRGVSSRRQCSRHDNTTGGEMTAYERITVSPIAGAIGAEIGGVDIAGRRRRCDDCRDPASPARASGDLLPRPAARR